MRKRAAIFDILFFLSWVFIFIPLVRCSLRSRLAVVSPFRRFFDGQLKAKKMVSREPEARSDTNKEPSGNKSSVSPKVAATYSPTTQCSTIGDAELNDPVPSPLSALSPASARSAVSRLCPLRSLQPLSAQLFSALSPAPARRRRAQPTPRMAHTAPHSATPPPMRQTRGGKRRLFLPTTLKIWSLSNKECAHARTCILYKVYRSFQ